MSSVIADPQTQQIKAPPYSMEAEQSVLGGLMLDNEAWDRVSELVVADDFFRKEHRLIFRAMTYLAGHSKPIDAITLFEFLEQEGEADGVGGLAYLTELAQNTPSVANIRAYADIVRERAVIREMIAVANEIADSGYYPKGRKSNELLDEAETKVFKIAEKREKSESGPENVNNLLQRTLKRIEEINESDGGITGLSTGFVDLDKMTSGMQEADLIIIAGRPSMGKTTFAMNIVEHAALSQDKPVLVFSMEMPSESLIMRSLSSIGRIDQTRIRTGNLQDDDWARLTGAFNQLKQSGNLFIDDSAGLSPSEVRARARRIVREHGGISLILIDYLQLMRVPGLSDNRTLEVGEISRSLKALAKELKCPVIALSQLNRSLEQRSDRRPVMSDLRESGSIEQDADLIMFIYRDEVYNKDSEENKGKAEIIIGKQRNGPIGTCHMAFIGKYTRFDNLAQDTYEDY